MPSAWIEELVWTEVRALLSDPERLQSLAHDFLDQRAVLVRSEVHAVDIDRKIAELELATTTRVASYLKAGLDPNLLNEAVTQLESELAEWRKQSEQVQAWSEQTMTVQDRSFKIKELAQRASRRLESLSPEEQRVVIEALELKVEVLSWQSCTSCGGSGKHKGGSGGFPCPACRMSKFLPTLRIDGIWVSDIGGERETLEKPDARAPLVCH